MSAWPCSATPQPAAAWPKTPRACPTTYRSRPSPSSPAIRSPRRSRPRTSATSDARWPTSPPRKETWELRGKVWADDRTLVGASDAGAHLDLIDSFDFATTVLAQGVREHSVISLEAAIHQITERPAVYFGLIDRGAIREGYHADLVVFDPATVGGKPMGRRYDLPGDSEAYRIYAEADGIDRVIVNGVEIVRHGEHTGALPGRLLRSGRDTRTVALDALQDEPVT
ncbi:MAG: amidohydrolase family protein [Sphingomonadales bacterium]|nr:amidohydrolase family protein [Sphingomonadales bacterium]